MKDPLLRRKLKRKYGLESVLVVERKSVEKIPDLFYYGITSKIFNRADKFVHRYDAEYNESLIQLIPYTMVFNKTENKIFTTKRLGGEERLIDEYSLGIGGHVNPKDWSDDTMLTAAERELREELNITLKERPSRYGTVRDINSSTGDHLGLVYLVHAAHISVKEKDKLSGTWMSYEDLITNYDKFESWSRHIIDHFFENKKISGKMLRGDRS